jgi:hypothetical protein
LKSPKEGDLKTMVSTNGSAHLRSKEGYTVRGSVGRSVQSIVPDRRESLQSGFPSSLATTEQQDKIESKSLKRMEHITLSRKK